MKIDGLVDKPGDYHLDDLIKPHALEERVYRLRCVEAWSMVIPWVGFPLGDLIERVEPTAPRSSSSSRRCTTRSRCPGSG